MKPRILIVEDDAVARRNLEHVLAKGQSGISPQGLVDTV